MKFNKQQLQAIDFYKGACAVIAGAGSGKSTVLINRIKNLIKKYNISENDILAISFTKNTADELKSNLNNTGYKNVNIGTFHAICGNIIQQECGYHPNTRLIRDWQVERLFEDMSKKNGKSIDREDVMSFIGYQKSYMKNYQDVFMSKDSNYDEEDLRYFFEEYENYKNKNNLLDFDDYLIECYKILKNNPNKYTFEYVLVDEHQDSNLIQNLLLKEICPSGNMFCVFDYRQAIYTFRGGNPTYCMNFSKDWKNATVINLDINYRSCGNIVHKSNTFIKNYYKDYEYYSDSKANIHKNGIIDIKTYYDKEIEAIEVADKIKKKIKNGEKPENIAVLYRLNSQSGYIEGELRKRGIEYDITNDASFFKRKEIEGIISYLRLIENPHDDGAFQNIFKLRNYPIKFFSNKILDSIKKFAGLHNLSLYESFIMIRYPKPWQKNNAKIFEDNIIKLRLQKDKGIDVITLIDNINKVFGIEEFIETKYTNKEDIEDRIKSIEILKSFVKSNTLSSFLAYVGNDNNGKIKRKGFQKSKVKLMTIHASKGLEFKNVFLIGIEDGKFPHEKSNNIDEARLFYVGITRAKENLFLSQIYNGNRFIKEFVA